MWTICLNSPGKCISCIGFLSAVLCNFVPIKSSSADLACFSHTIRSPLAPGWHKHHQEVMVLSSTCCPSANIDKPDRCSPRNFKLGAQTWLICWWDGVGWSGLKKKRRKGRIQNLLYPQNSVTFHETFAPKSIYDATPEVSTKWFITIWQSTPGFLVTLWVFWALYLLPSDSPLLDFWWHYMGLLSFMFNFNGDHCSQMDEKYPFLHHCFLYWPQGLEK